MSVGTLQVPLSSRTIEPLLDMATHQPRVQSRYVVVSPVRNEAQHLETTIRSMVRQTVLPRQWIVVNDDSTDATGAILDHWAARYSWIVPVHAGNHDDEVDDPPESRLSRGQRAYEAKEIKAFFAGYNQITASDWEYLVKLDGDLGFESDYFERCFTEFETDPKLGIGGGVICSPNGEIEAASSPEFHVRGATKIYRRACWEQVGGVLDTAAWDTIDEVKANMMGWSTHTFNNLRVVHYRFTGSANGAWQNSVKNGAWSYISGYHPLFLMGRCARQMLERPFIMGSVGMFCGYVKAWIQRVPQVEDKSVIHYLREQQLRRLSLRSTVWK